MTEQTVETAAEPKPKPARAAKAAKPPDDGPLVAALLKVLDGAALPLVPAKGFEGSLFPAAAAGKALLTRALEAGYVEECDAPPLPPPPPGAKKAKAPAKLPQYGRITDKGREWVLEHTSPRQAMEGLLAAFERQSGALDGPEADVSTLRAQLGELQHGLAQTRERFDAQVSELTGHLEKVKTNVESQIATLTSALQKATQNVESQIGVLTGALEKATRNVDGQIAGFAPHIERARAGIDAVVERRRADMHRVVETMQAVSTHLTRSVESERAKSAPRADLSAEAVAFADAFRREKGADCPLPELYAHLKGKQPALTVGAFHDLVRKLHHAHDLRLTAWSDTLDALPEPELAVFVASKVMYYAHVPEGQAP